MTRFRFCNFRKFTLFGVGCVPKLDDIDVIKMWFQVDEVTCQTVRETIQLLHKTFSGHILSRFGDQIGNLNLVI